MAKKAKTPVVSYGRVIPQTFGAAGDAINQFVTFGIGTVDKIIPCSDSSIGLIAFGYDSSLKSGAIAVGGELVTSKILDISTDATELNPKPSVVTVKYLDSSYIKDFSFSVIDPSVIEILDSSLNNLYQEVINNEEAIVNYLEYLNASILDVLDASLNNLYQELIDDEEILVNYFEILNTSINNNTLDISLLRNQINQAYSAIDNLGNNYVSSIEANNSSAIIVDSISGALGKQYRIGVAVDNESVKVENGVLTATGNTYSIKSLAIPTDGFLKTYQLYQTDAAGNETAIPNSIIDIPKDYVLKEVHLCKATTEEVDNVIVYTETAISTDPDFDQAEGELYLHIIWQTKDVSTMTSETYIKVTDMAPVYTGDADANTSDGKYITISDSHVVSLDTSKLYDDIIEPLDASVQNIFKQLEDDEKVLVEYFTILDTSINQNTYDISTLRAELESSDQDLEDLEEYLENLNSSVSNIEENYVQSVNASIKNSSLTLRKNYVQPFDNGTAVEAIRVGDASVSYKISQVINGTETEVVTINTINPSIINDIADILTDYASRIDGLDNKISWVML